MWLAGLYRLWFSPSWLLPRDNFSIHYDLFEYVSLYWRNFGAFPTWNYRFGVPLAPLANNHILIAPYRWPGYLAVKWGLCSPAAAYKFCFLFLGQGIFWVGIWLLLRTLFNSRKWAAFGVALGLLSPLHFAIYHQEQAFASIFFAPWFVYALLRFRAGAGSRFSLYYAATLAGLAMNQHYPQIVLIAIVVAFLVFPRALPRKLKQLLPAIACLLIAAAPVIYAYLAHAADLKSPFREQETSIFSQSYSDYQKLNLLGPSSLSPRNFSLLAHPLPTYPPAVIGDMDALSLHYGGWFGLLLILSLFYPVPGRWQYWGLLVGFALCSTGIHGPIPRLLFPWFPGISLFRQWYHFLPFFHFTGLLFSVAILQFLWRRKNRFIFATIALITVLSSSHSTKSALAIVTSRLISTQSVKLAPQEPSEFSNWLWFKHPYYPPLSIPKWVSMSAVNLQLKTGLPNWQPTTASPAHSDPVMKPIPLSPAQLGIEWRGGYFWITPSPTLRYPAKLLVRQASHRDWHSQNGIKVTASPEGLVQYTFEFSQSIAIRATEPVWLFALWLSYFPALVLVALSGRSPNPHRSLKKFLPASP